MKRINYFLGCEEEYLKILGLKENGKFTDLYNNLNDEWKKFLKDYSYSFFPTEVKDILVCSYEVLVNYFIAFQNEIFKKTKTNFKKFKNKLEKINKYFDKFTYFKYSYTKKGDMHFSDKIADFFIQHEKEINIYSCFYCDSAYAGVFDQTNLKVDKKRRTFDVDHFFPNAQYPMFSLSLYNFVPSCQICNSRIKGSSNFLNFYQFIYVNSKNQITKAFDPQKTKDELLLISPISEKYNANSNIKIKVYPKLQQKNKTEYELWNYHPEFSNNCSDYSLQFDVNEKTPYQKIVDAFLLQERYNNIAIKSKALYLLDLKRKYPDSNIKMMSNLLTAEDKVRKIGTFRQLKNAIFHKDDKYALLQKLRDDILDD